MERHGLTNRRIKTTRPADKKAQGQDSINTQHAGAKDSKHASLFTSMENALPKVSHELVTCPLRYS